MSKQPLKMRSTKTTSFSVFTPIPFFWNRERKREPGWRVEKRLEERSKGEKAEWGR
jgi:hypothetical protein